MTPFDLEQHSHWRLNPLTRDWVLVSPARAARPWQGQVEPARVETVPPYDPECYMCPGNMRAGGKRNPAYAQTFVFDNDFPALLRAAPAAGKPEGSNLLVARPESGTCRVVCFSPRHDLTFAKMKVSEIRAVVDVWAEQSSALGREPAINYVTIFENRSAMMGASNPHPHGQIWANATIPPEPAKEQASLIAHQQELGVCLLCSYAQLESTLGARMVCQNEGFAAIVPFWAVWPFETIVISRRHLPSIEQLTEAERGALADILKRLTAGYDNLFHAPFPYSMGFHQRPTDGNPHGEWHFHAHFYPPLLRSATVRKFMVGYEMLAAPQRDITAEYAAVRLREACSEHGGRPAPSEKP